MTLLAVVITSGCAASDAEDARAAWLQSTLTDDNRDIIWRNPNLVAAKYRKMAASPYNFLRGTVLQWLRDLQQPGEDLGTAFGTAATSQVQLIGDPHPENIGSYLPADGALTLDFNDFDAARYGPYWSDVWRMVQGFEVLARGDDPTAPDQYLSPEQRQTVRRAIALGYFDQLHALARGEPGPRFGPGNGHGPIVEDLFARAQDDGDIREQLLEYACRQETPARLGRGLVGAKGPRDPGTQDLRPFCMLDGFAGQPADLTAEELQLERLYDVDAETRAYLERTLAEYRTTLHDPSLDTDAAFEILDVARQVGSGVSSFALFRFYVLVQGPTASPADDWLLEAKEIRDPAVLGRINVFPPRQFTTNAERVVSVQRRLQTTRDNDPLLGWGRSANFSLRVRHRTKYQKGLDHERIQDDIANQDLTAEDLADLAGLAGRLLARTHATAPLASGEDALSALVAAIGDDREAFADEVDARNAAYADRIYADYDRFLRLLETHGELLGYRERIR